MSLVLDVSRPSHLWIPERRGSYLDEVRDVAKMIGRPLDAAQEIAVDALTSYGAGGRWLTMETGLKLPRQNGKTAGIATPIVLADLFLWGADRIAWTAHLFKTSREAFQDHLQLIEGCPEFKRRIRRVRQANGEEGIELTSGARLEYLARSKASGRGLGGKRVVIDEALFFMPEQAGALLPILAARENPQINYMSSACKVESEQLRALTRRGRAMNDPSLIWVEWCAPGSLTNPGCANDDCLHVLGTPDCVLDDEEYLQMANPAVLAGRISMESLRALRRSLPPIEFAREFLGWDEDPAEMGTTIPLDAWLSRVDIDSYISGGRALGFDIAPDRKTSAIGGAGHRADGDAVLELIEHRAGTRWLVPRLLELVERYDPVAVVVDGASPAGSEIDALKAAGLQARTKDNPSGRLVVLSASDMGHTCGRLFDSIAGDVPNAWHRGDAILQSALTGAARRDVGDGGWAFGRRRSDADISPLVAVAEALFGLSSISAPAPWAMVSWR